MTANDSSIYASAPFKFMIDRKAIYIHANLVSRHSKPLDRMINGHMAEAQQGFAVLKEVDEMTFTRFVQWAYHGFYSSAEFGVDATEDLKRKTPSRVEAVTEMVAKAREMRRPARTPKKHQMFGISQKRVTISPTSSPIYQTPSTKRSLKESFLQRQRTTHQAHPHGKSPRPNEQPNEDYTEVFLCHARLYVFAEQYDVQPLKLLAFEELQTTLARFTLYAERTGDIVALLRYVYANTGDSVAGAEDIRTMLTTYVGYEMDILVKDGKFMRVMVEDGGAMLWDFMKMVAKRIEPARPEMGNEESD